MNQYFVIRHEDYINDSHYEGPQGITLSGYERLFHTADLVISKMGEFFPTDKIDRVVLDIFYNHIPRVHNTAYLLMEILRKKGANAGITKISEDTEVPAITEDLVKIKIQESKKRYEGYLILCGFISHEADLNYLVKSNVDFGKVFFLESI